MDELNQIRIRARNRLLICIGCVFGAGVLVSALARNPLAFFFVAVIGAVICFLVVRAPRKEYREAFKRSVVRQSLESVFTDVVYEPDLGISYETIAGTKMMSMGDRFHSEDYISAAYRDIRFEQSDVHIEE